MTTHFHVDGALWEGDYSAQARTILLTDRLFQKKLEGTLDSIKSTQCTVPCY